MRPLIVLLLILLLGLQYKLWFGHSSISQLNETQESIVLQQQENTKVEAENEAILADIRELKSGDQALEAHARSELGMITEKEEYYQFIEP